MDHSGMDHGGMDHGGHNMPGMDHGHKCNMNVRFLLTGTAGLKSLING